MFYGGREITGYCHRVISLEGLDQAAWLLAGNIASFMWPGSDDYVMLLLLLFAWGFFGKRWGDVVGGGIGRW